MNQKNQNKGQGSKAGQDVNAIVKAIMARPDADRPDCAVSYMSGNAEHDDALRAALVAALQAELTELTAARERASRALAARKELDKLFVVARTERARVIGPATIPIETLPTERGYGSKIMVVALYNATNPMKPLDFAKIKGCRGACQAHVDHLRRQGYDVKGTANKGWSLDAEGLPKGKNFKYHELFTGLPE